MTAEIEKPKWGTKCVPLGYNFLWGAKWQNGVRMAALMILYVLIFKDDSFEENKTTKENDRTNNSTYERNAYFTL